MITDKHKVFCSYAFTAENGQAVNERMKLITNTLTSGGVATYCNLFDERTDGLDNPRQVMDVALRELKASDIVLVIMATERRSEGMLIEIGAAYAIGKPIILARHESTKGKTYVDQLATKTVDWQTNADLVKIIQSLIA